MSAERANVRRASSATAWLTCAILAYAVPGGPAVAQERVRFHTDVTLYGDNTEFHNRFRDGATLLGTAGTFAVDVELGDSAFFRGGIFLNHRIGSARFAEQWRPVFSLTVDRGPSRFIFGTLDTGPEEGVFAPDLGGPHGLIPPLQVETLAYTRPHEGGLQWQLDARRIGQDAWINWQRLNTAEHRERFDAGLRGRLPLGTPIPMAVAYQLHHVHEGGQLFDPGPVADSFAGGPGLVVEPPLGLFDSSSVEAYLMWSKHVPDRAAAEGRLARPRALRAGGSGEARLARALHLLERLPLAEGRGRPQLRVTLPGRLGLPADPPLRRGRARERSSSRRRACRWRDRPARTGSRRTTTTRSACWPACTSTSRWAAADAFVGPGARAAERAIEGSAPAPTPDASVRAAPGLHGAAFCGTLAVRTCRERTRRLRRSWAAGRAGRVGTRRGGYAQARR